MIASVTYSQYAVWLNWPAGPNTLVAETEGLSRLSRVISLVGRTPRLFNDVDPRDGVPSIAAAPVMFRSSITGVLAVADGALPYTAADLDLLDQTGRAAVLEYESLERAEALGVVSPGRKTADLVHGLRQPLGILEACAFVLDLILPAGENRAREQLAEMQRQLHRASGILDESAHAACRGGQQGFDVTPPAGEASRILTNSAMSMVT